MSDPSLARPLHHEAAFEQAEEGEAQTTQELEQVLVQMAQTMANHTGHARRSVHAKSHGLLRGELTVLPGLPAQLAHGIFAEAETYPLLMRISSTPAEELPDNVSTPRGMAVKVLEVRGERLPGSEGDNTQDLVMVNGPAFIAPDARTFLKSARLLATTTDKAPAAKQFLSALLRGTEAVVEALGGESATLKGMGGHPHTHPLGESFFTQAPLMYGPFMAKLCVVPVSPELCALTGAPLAMLGKPDAMREAVIDFFAQPGVVAEWEVRVQLCTDIERMPIEDSSVPWPEALSPYRGVARIKVAAQAAWSPARAQAMDDALAFSPWHGITAHRPLGSIMRVRQSVYAASSAFRGQFNGCPMHEPRSAAAFSQVDGVGGA